MNHVIVSRVSAVLVILLGASVIGFALLVARTQPPADGAVERTGIPREGGEGSALFETHCGRCHSAASLARTLAESNDPEALAGQWEVFLERHGKASAEQDRIIVRYLAEKP